MGLFGSIGDFFSDVAGVFGDVFDFIGDVAETVYKGAIDAAEWLITANLDVADFMKDEAAPYVAAAVGYYYGGPAGAQAAYNLAGGEGFGSSIEKQSPGEWAATVVSAYTGGESSFLADAIAIGYGVLSPDAGGDGTTIGGVDVFSEEARTARLQVFQDAYKTAMREPYYVWRKKQPAYLYHSTHTGGADADPDEANHSGANLYTDPSISFGRFLATEGGDYSSIEAIMANPYMAGTAIGDAYLTLEAYKDTAIAAQNAGVPGLDEPVDPDRGDDMYIIGGTGEPGGTTGDNILSGIDSILGLVGGQQEAQDIDITTTTNIQLPSEPAKMPSIRELDNLDQGLFASGPLVRATRKVDVARAQAPSAPVKSMWNRSGLGITG